MFSFVEQILSDLSFTVCGVDEAGAGPLCGDVFAAAVILDPHRPIKGLADSKKLSEKKREKLYPEIQEKALFFCVARATVKEIDTINVLQARMLAMSRAVQGLNTEIDYVMVDGNRLPEPLPGIGFPWIGGDQLLASIMAASILAKVDRDHEMILLDKQYPNYGLAKHKGYGTKAHLEALERFGPTPIHRRSFGPVKRLLG
ncbi:MAG: ribonuclease HII [Pseudomonadales bacterium]|nr:ribonuclease HII [Pseudomonadales bacterium]